MRKYQCIFADPLIRKEVNPRLAKLAEKPPYGAMQRAWRELHCSEVNPYGSESCPYEARDCVLAYYKTASDALTGARRSSIGYFRILAKRRGYDRAENKPLARERQERTDGQRSGFPPAPAADLPAGQAMPRSAARPVRLGDLFGSPDDRARDRRQPQGEEGVE